MRIRRAIIIPAILALGVTGSAVAGSAVSAAPSAHKQVVAVSAPGSQVPSRTSRLRLTAPQIKSATGRSYGCRRGRSHSVAV